MNISNLDFVDDIKVESVSGAEAGVWSSQSFFVSFNGNPESYHTPGEVKNPNAHSVTARSQVTGSDDASVYLISWASSN